MAESKSTDKLRVLGEIASNLSGKIESCDSIKLTWTCIPTTEEDLVVPEVEIIGLKMKS